MGWWMMLEPSLLMEGNLSVKHRLQTADQAKIWSEGKMQTADLDWGKMNTTPVRLNIIQVSLVYNA